jgi:hypothetical protein
VEIVLARELYLADGTALDYTIAGADVDCKFSHRLGGWMIPPDAGEPHRRGHGGDADDFMKRVRDGGGARDQLRAEGIVIFGDYAADQVLACALGLPRPGPGEFVSARLTRRRGGGPDFAGSIRLDGAGWRLAAPGDPPEPAPRLAR